MSGIFISYRRDDSAGHAGRLFDRLRERFGRQQVFMDVAGIDPGTDFVRAIDIAVSACDTLLVVIGRDWLACTDAHGQRRLDDPNDFVRLEVGTALKRDIRVVPVLVQNAAMPGVDELPDDLKLLIRRQATELSDERWDLDVQDLIAKLERRDRPAGTPARGALLALRRGRDKWTAAGVAVLLAAAGGATWWWFAKVEVPSLAGLGEDQAADRLREAKLAVGRKDPRPAPAGIRDGTIIRQAPAAGSRVASGTAVALVIARRPLARVPNLVGKTLGEAKTLLQQATLGEGRNELRESTEVRPGLIVSQSPAPGTEVAADSQVDIVIAALRATPTAVGVIEFDTGTLEFGALPIGSLRAANLTVTNTGRGQITVREVRLDANREDFPLYAQPCIDNTLVPGERCRMQVYFSPKSAGNHHAALTVVDADGKLHTGVALVGTGAPPVPKAASPEPRVRGGRPQPEEVSVPIVVHLSLREAGNLLTQAGLKTGAVRRVTVDSVEPGMVLQQNPGPGNAVGRDTTVNLAVSTKPAGSAPGREAP